MRNLWTTQETAGFLGINRSTVARMAARGTLPPQLQLPGRTGAFLFAAEDVERIKRELDNGLKPSGRCEDYPSCGHEAGDCNGLLYGSDEAIKTQVQRAWDTGHGYCDHESGIYNCSVDEDREHP